VSQLVFDDRGRALIFDRVTGEVSAHAVPTAIENVANGQGRFCHGSTGERMEGPEEPAPVEEPVVALSEEGVLELPAGETGIKAAPAPASPGPRPRSRRKH
jgi:hypothetical protein